MSEREGARPALAPSIFSQRARLSLAMGVPAISDQLDLAEHCLAAGEVAAARMCYEAAFIRQGFSRQARARFAAIAARTGLWPAFRPAVPPPAPAAATVAIAVEEMAALGREAGRRAHHGPGRSDAVRPATSRSRPDTIEPDDLARQIGALFGIMAGEAPPDDRGMLQARLDPLRAACETLPLHDCAAFAGAPLPLLAAAMSIVTMRRFFADMRDLIDAPFGSPHLFWHAARLDGAGLGPFLGNVRRIVRDSRDMFELASIAAAAGGVDRPDLPDLEPWLALLARGLAGGMWLEVIDELGDRGAMAALSGVLRRVIGAEPGIVTTSRAMRIRDAALDNLAFDLAARAQRFVIDQDPAAIHEHVILASIDATAGRIVAAEQTLMACLAKAPDDADIVARLDALRRRRFAPYELTRGFATPEDRQIKRLRRRAGLDFAAASTAVEERINGVELT